MASSSSSSSTRIRPVAPVREAHEVELLEGARELFPAMIEAIEGALHEVALETYIFDVAGDGAQVAEALIRAAGRGVLTRVVVDGIGTARIPAPWPERFERAGVQWRVFAPLGLWGWFRPGNLRRLHRKLCVVDGVTAFCGGINILDDWLDPNWGRLSAPRLDFAVCVRGELAAEVRKATRRLWRRLDALHEVRRRDLGAALRTLAPDMAQAEDAAVSVAQRFERQRAHAIDARPGAAAVPAPRRFSVDAALLLRDNLRNRNRIERAYRKAIDAARHEVVIACAYFLPGRKLRHALKQAARRGVRVQLLLQGRYEYFLQYHAVRPVYHALLAAGVEIHEYAPSFLHAKVAAIDADGARPWATVGSSNLDPLSLLLAREANVVIEAQAFAQALRDRLRLAIRQEGRRIEPQQFGNRPWRERLLDRLAFWTMRAALLLAGRLRY